jgi:hypothetical protein
VAAGTGIDFFSRNALAVEVGESRGAKTKIEGNALAQKLTGLS